MLFTGTALVLCCFVGLDNYGDMSIILTRYVIIFNENYHKRTRNTMSNYNIDANPFEIVLIVLPFLTLAVSLVLQLFLKKRILIMGIIFCVYLIATFTVFNSSFLIWCFVYTGISLIGTLIADFFLKSGKKRAA